MVPLCHNILSVRAWKIHTTWPLKECHSSKRLSKYLIWILDLHGKKHQHKPEMSWTDFSNWIPLAKWSDFHLYYFIRVIGAHWLALVLQFLSASQNHAVGLIDGRKFPISVNASGDGCLFLSVVLQKMVVICPGCTPPFAQWKLGSTQQ